MSTLLPNAGADLEPPEPWQLKFDNYDTNDFPDGLRLSEDCVCARLRRPLFTQADGTQEPESPYRNFPLWLNARGHGIERMITEDLERKGHVVLREVTVPWGHGESHLDLVIVSGPLVDQHGGKLLVREVKANDKAQLKSENVRQVQRQMHVVDRIPAMGATMRYKQFEPDGKWRWHDVPFEPEQLSSENADWRIWVVDPLTWRIPLPDGYGPVPLTEERVAELDAEHELMDRYMAQIDKLDRDWENDWPPCSSGCSKCWPAPVTELPERLFGHVHGYLHALDEEKAAAAEKTIHRDALKEGLAERRKFLGLGQAPGPTADPDKVEDERGRRWEGGGVYVLEQKNGAIRCGESKVQTLLL